MSAADWTARPLTLDQRLHTVYAAGQRGQIWNPEFVFDRRDDGAFRIQLHAQSPADGLFLTIATNTDQDVSMDPVQIVIDEAGTSYVTYMRQTIAHAQGARFPRNKPAWVWVRYARIGVGNSNAAQIWVGFGPHVGERTIMQGTINDDQGGGYMRFACGKTGNNGAFELLDVSPLERRDGRRQPW